MIVIKKESIVGELGDFLFSLIMRLGTPEKKTQRTHGGNLQVLSEKEVKLLKPSRMIKFEGIPGEMVQRGWGKILFHFPRLGGWRRYVVLEPQLEYIVKWHIGWLKAEKKEISRIPIFGPVRMLLSPDEVSFFAFDSVGNQIPLRKIGEGRIGDRGIFSEIQLL